MDRVELHGRVPRTEALSAARGADLAVVITSVAEEAIIEDQGIVTGKVFEAMGMGVPILLIAPHGSDATEIVEGTGAGRRFSASDIELMSQYILSLARSARKPAGAHERYSWPMLADQLNEILRRVTNKENGQGEATGVSGPALDENPPVEFAPKEVGR